MSTAGRRLATIGAASVAALSVAATLGLGWDVLRLDAAIGQGVGAGSSARLVSIERDLANLRVALVHDGLEARLGRYGDLRSQIGAALAGDPQTAARMPQAVEELARLAQVLDRLIVDGGFASGDAQVDAQLAIHARSLSDLVADVATQEAQESGAISAALDARGTRTLQLLAAAAAALAALGMLIALRRNNGQGLDPAVVAARQAAMDEGARLARARFVMMMSHELRTPLNGVLGLLSVMKEANPPTTLKPLIDQAERAGQQLTAMLHDMLEVESAATSAPQPVAPQAFSPGGLAQSMQDLYAPVASVGGPSFIVTTKGEMPETASGDGVRFQRAVSHLCSHVMDTAGVEDVELEISHTGAEVRAELTFAHKAGPEAGLRLIEPAAGTSEAGDEVTGVGLGPLLAKGLLDQMGGRLEIATLDTGRILVLAATPSQAVAAEHCPRVRVVARTRSLGALGAAAASAAGVDVLAADSAPQPDIVLVEAGGEEEARAVAEVRSQWPGAYLMALGDPDAPDLFDALIQPPLDPFRVAAAVTEAWERCKDGQASAKPSGPLRKVG
jgi:signal transduction histidine kinase